MELLASYLQFKLSENAARVERMHEKRFECAGNASALSVGQKRLKADSKHMVAF